MTNNIILRNKEIVDDGKMTPDNLLIGYNDLDTGSYDSVVECGLS